MICKTSFPTQRDSGCDTKTPDQTYELAKRLLCCTLETELTPGLKVPKKGACVGRTTDSNLCLNSVRKLLVSTPDFTAHSAGGWELGGETKRQKGKKKEAEREKEGLKERGWRVGVCLSDREREVITLC